ncbi:MAG: acyl-CoA thioesterase [Planctomycetota bacterium]
MTSELSMQPNAKELSAQDCGASVLSWYDFRHTVSDEEMDSQNHVHNLRYLQWALWAAGRHAAQCGWKSDVLQREKGVGWVVREHHVQYRRAAFGGDEIVVRTWLEEISRVACKRRFVIYREADMVILARGWTRYAYVDLVNRKSIRMPDDLYALIPVASSVPPPGQQS